MFRIYSFVYLQLIELCFISLWLKPLNVLKNYHCKRQFHDHRSLCAAHNCWLLPYPFPVCVRVFYFILLAIPSLHQPIRRTFDCVRRRIFVTLISPVDRRTDAFCLLFHVNIYRRYHFASNKNLLSRWNKNFVSICDARFLWA